MSQAHPALAHMVGVVIAPQPVTPTVVGVAVVEVAVVEVAVGGSTGFEAWHPHISGQRPISGRATQQSSHRQPPLQ